MPEIAAMSPGGWLGATGASDGPTEGGSNGTFDQASDEDDRPNIFAENGGAGPSSVMDAEDDVVEDKLDDDDEPSDLDIPESRELSTNGLSPEGENGASPSFGEEDAEGTDEPSAATDGEGAE